MSAMRYAGGGAFHIGVPARDLTAEEAEQHRAVLADSPLYEAIDGLTDAQPAGGETPADDDSQGE